MPGANVGLLTTDISNSFREPRSSRCVAYRVSGDGAVLVAIRGAARARAGKRTDRFGGDLFRASFPSGRPGGSRRAPATTPVRAGDARARPGFAAGGAVRPAAGANREWRPGPDSPARGGSERKDRTHRGSHRDHGGGVARGGPRGAGGEGALRRLW